MCGWNQHHNYRWASLRNISYTLFDSGKLCLQQEIRRARIPFVLSRGNAQIRAPRCVEFLPESTCHVFLHRKPNTSETPGIPKALFGVAAAPSSCCRTTSLLHSTVDDIS